MTLHTLNAPPSSAAFSDCLKVLGEGDALVLLGDGVYAAIEGSDACRALVDSAAALYVLAADARLAGVTLSGGDLRAIDMDGLVTLTQQYPRQQAWY